MRRWLGWVGLNLAVALLLYARTLPYEFVFDDHQRVEDNRALESVFPLSRFFSPQSQSSDKTLPRHTYRPVTTLSWALESAVFGKRPAVYRLGNIVLHGLNGALLGWIGVVLFGLAWPAALLASLLFLVHPLQSEAVAWISGRSDVLSLTLMLSAWVCWIRFRTEDRRPETRRRDAVASFGLFVLALLTRESAVCLPVALILGDTLKRQRLSWATYAPFIVTAVLFVALRSHVIGQFAQMSYWGGSLFSNALNVLHVWSLYLEKIFWPSNLRVVYWSIPVLTGWSASAIGGLVGLIFFGMAEGQTRALGFVDAVRGFLGAHLQHCAVGDVVCGPVGLRAHRVPGAGRGRLWDVDATPLVLWRGSGGGCDRIRGNMALFAGVEK